MKYHDSDEIGYLTIKAAQEFGCNLDVRISEDVIGYAAERFRPGEGKDFEELLERGLDRNEPLTDTQRHAYKHIAGKTFYNRKKAALDVQRELDQQRPFAPSEQDA